MSPALFLAVFLFFSEAVAATAENETDKVTASVITSSEKVNPTQDIDVLIRLQMHDDWHTYWSNPGDAGLSTQVKWQLPEGYVVEEPVLSRPQKFMFDGLVQYGYGDVAYLRTKIKPQPESLPEGSRKYFSAVVSWLACKDVCVPETVKLNFMLPVTNRLTEISQEWAAEAAAAKPRFSHRPDWKALYEVKDGNRLLINIDSQIEIAVCFQIEQLAHILAGGVLEGGGLNDGDLARLAVAGGVAALHTDGITVHTTYSFAGFLVGKDDSPQEGLASGGESKNSKLLISAGAYRSWWPTGYPQTGTPAPSAPAAPHRRS